MLNDQLRTEIVSITYRASSLTSVCPLNVKKPPPRVRSNGSRMELNRGNCVELGAFGFSATFGCNSAPAHCVGLVNPATGVPVESRHGALSVESTIERRS